jgi:hypothetical protein
MVNHWRDKQFRILGPLAVTLAVVAVLGAVAVVDRHWRPGPPETRAPILPPVEEPAERPSAGLANPASVFCIDHGGTVDVMAGWDEGQIGICVFSNGFRCEEWAMFRGECPIGGIAVLSTWDAAEARCAILGGEVLRRNGGLEPSLCRYRERICAAGDFFRTGKCE